MPTRHQRKRQAGFKLPSGVICVTRPGKFGNPYRTALDFRCALIAVLDGKPMTTEREKHRKEMEVIASCLHEIKGKDLACWCKLGNDCHADVLLEFANGTIL